MFPHTRAMVAAAAYAFVNGKTVAGVYDHVSARHLRIAAESRGDSLQGYDGDRSVRFGGTLPELYDTGDKAFVSLTIDGSKGQGFDRLSSTAYVAEVSDRGVQLFDHGPRAWFAFDVQTV